MKAIIFIAFLGLAFSCQAQKVPKNELSLGYFTAGYFFDSTGIKLSEFERGRNLTLNYTRHLGKNLSFSVTYLKCWYQYVHSPLPQYYQDNTIFRRNFRLISINTGYGITKWSMYAKLKAGINYRFNGDKKVHYFYFGGGGPWVESVGEYLGYKEFGATFGCSVSHPIFWKLFGEIDCEYARMFPKAYRSIGSITTSRDKVRADPQQLLLSYRIGIRF